MSQSLMERKRIRKSFGRIESIAPMPNLIEVQKNSYASFLQTGPDRPLSPLLRLRETTGVSSALFCATRQAVTASPSWMTNMPRPMNPFLSISSTREQRITTNTAGMPMLILPMIPRKSNGVHSWPMTATRTRSASSKAAVRSEKASIVLLKTV